MIKPPDSLSTFAAFLARHSAIIALAVFAVVGVAVLDDYGVSYDLPDQTRIGSASFDYILGDEDALIEGHHNRLYGVAFEVPLVAVERLLRLEASRDAYLSRHLLTHLFFLAGGFFAWLLAYRLFGSRLVALLAMLIFLLHPRLYAHSFFNSKDLPFLSMFMIALYLIHRAFRRDAVWAFALCGAGVGLLANIRVLGVALVPAVLGMLALDALRAAKGGERGGAKKALANAGAFFAASATTLYAASPALWRDPTSLLDALRVASSHPTHISTLFRGERVLWSNIPWDYIPTWILITTPPAALALAALGIAYVGGLCVARRRDAFANSTARFGLLAAACLILPVAAAVALNSNLYNGWRQLYFLYAPTCVLAAFGLRALAEIPKPRLRAAAYALAALGICVSVVEMVRLHPQQNDYFSPLVNKGGLAERWEMNYWRASYKEALDALMKMQPSGRIYAVAPRDPYIFDWNARLLRRDDRRRLFVNPNFPSFLVVPGDGEDAGYEALWKREVYGVPIVSIGDVRAESEAAYRATYAAARASAPLASGGGFAIYQDGDALIYAKEGCGETDARGRFFLSVFPVDQDDLPQTARDAGLEHEPLNFDFHRYGAIFDGKCVIVRELPDYPISRIETGQWIPGEGGLWRVEIVVGD